MQRDTDKNSIRRQLAQLTRNRGLANPKSPMSLRQAWRREPAAEDDEGESACRARLSGVGPGKALRLLPRVVYWP